MIPEREARAMRATGTAFAILYAPRTIPDTATAPQKRGPKPKVNADQSYKAKVLRDLDNSKPAFNVAIATQKERDRTASIKGRM